MVHAEVTYYVSYNANVSRYNSSNNVTTNIATNNTITYAYDIATNRDTGQYLLIAGQTIESNGNFTFYKSSNYGNTISLILNQDPAFTGSLGISNVGAESKTCLSDDGKYQYFGFIYDVGIPSKIRIYRSTDYGVTWNYAEITQNSVNAFSSLGCSANGQYVILTYGISGSTEYMRISQNYGANFTYLSLSNVTGTWMVSDRTFISDTGLSVITNEYQYNTLTGTRTNYTSNYAGANIYTDGLATIIVNGDCTGTYLVGDAQSGTYTTIQDVGTNCYGVDALESFNKIYLVSQTPLNLFDSVTQGTGFNAVTSLTNTAIDVETSGQVIQNASAQCISQNTYCNNPYYTYGVIQCNLDDIEYCGEGCIGSTCLNTQQNACDINGESKCSDTTTRAICEDYDGDGYLEFDTLESCDVGSYCIDGFHVAFCTNTTANGVHNQYALSVTPYAISSENISYYLDSSKRTLDVKSIFTLHEQKFYTTGTQYLSRTCDYTESPRVEMMTPTENVGYNQYVFSNVVGENNIIRFSFTPTDYDNGTIEFRSQADVSMGLWKYKRNVTAKSFCIYWVNNSEVFCDYDYQPTDTLQNVFLEYTYEMSSKSFTTKFYMNRTNPVIKISYPRLVSGVDIASLIFNSTNTTISYYTINAIPVFNSFSVNNNITLINVINYDACDCGVITCAEYKFLHGEDALKQICGAETTTPYLPVPCIFLSENSYNVRTYGNNNGIPDYSTYQDYIVNVNTLGATPQELSDENGGKSAFMNGSGLSQGMKFFIVTLFIIIVFIAFAYIGYENDSIGITMTIATIISTLALITFTIFGWIPAWVIVMVIILAIAVVILLSKTNNVSTG